MLYCRCLWLLWGPLLSSAELDKQRGIGESGRSVALTIHLPGLGMAQFLCQRFSVLNVTAMAENWFLLYFIVEMLKVPLFSWQAVSEQCNICHPGPSPNPTCCFLCLCSILPWSHEVTHRTSLWRYLSTTCTEELSHYGNFSFVSFDLLGQKHRVDKYPSYQSLLYTCFLRKDVRSLGNLDIALWLERPLKWFAQIQSDEDSTPPLFFVCFVF